MKAWYLVCLLFASQLAFAAQALEGKEELEGEEDQVLLGAAEADLHPSEISLAPAAAKMPPRRINKGTHKLLCIGVKYSTGQIAAGQPGCANLGNILKEFWERNSRGMMKILPEGKEPFDCGLPGASNGTTWQQARVNYDKAVDMIKAKYPGYDYYVIPGIYTGPHASGKVAHVKSTQGMTAEHETGHLIGLGHAGVYDFVKGQWVYSQYADRTSIMGRIISRYITAPQYYWLGWLPDEEVVVLDPAVKTYDLKKIGDSDVKGLATVIVPPEMMPTKGGKWAFISASACGGKKVPGCLTLHLAAGGASQRIAQVPTEFWDDHFTGLHAKVVQNVGTKIRVAIDFDKKPLPQK